MTAPATLSARSARIATFAIWLVCCAVLLVIGQKYVTGFTFRDADDALRLVEVRDWLAGQGWFDLTQHRVFPPQGVPMHWSRIVDLPLAAGISLLSPFTSQITAERITLALVPLLTFLCLFAILHALTLWMTRRPAMAVIGSIILAMSLGIVIQFLPMRIDHHGWQIVFDSLAALFLLRALDKGIGQAVLAGLAMAASLAIAIEGLPLAVALAGGLALLYLTGRANVRLLIAYLAGLTGSCALLLLATRGLAQALVPWCDALSPAYIAPMAGATAVLAVAAHALGDAKPVRRLAVLMLAAGVGALIFATTSKPCLAGPFGALDPMVYRFWYRSVGEGMPVWTQPLDVAILVPLPGLLGLVGTLLALRVAPAERRDAWLLLLVLQLVTFAVSMIVMRAMGIAHALAIPGTAWLFMTALDAAMRYKARVRRILLGFGCFALTPIGAEAVAYTLLVPPPTADDTEARWTMRFTCTTYKALRGFDAMGPALVFTPLDIGPDLLVYTHHSLVATGHHRNQAGMKMILSAFLSPPDTARPIVQGSGARYLAYCAGQKEVTNYVKFAPRGLMARLDAGQVPDWLEKVRMAPDESIQVYRIRQD